MDLQTQPQLGITFAPGEWAFIVPLSEVSRADVHRVGVKAANLGELLRAKFPVPDGFIMTTAAFERFLSANAIGIEQTPEAVANSRFPGDLADALRAALAPLNGTPLAVRSSGVAEDLPGASFAGQDETVLDARGYPALVDAIRQCWAAAFSRRIAVYRGVRRQSGSGSMAVLVQGFIQVNAAAVTFTANPVNGHRDETVVIAVRGSGKRLVSGNAVPDEWTVTGEEAVFHSGHEGAINAALAREIAGMARQAEKLFGAPQVIEWAIKNGEPYMLQARPISTLRETAIEPVLMKWEEYAFV